MPTHRLIVFTDPVPGCEDEFNDWYDAEHLDDVLACEGFVAAQRFRLSDAQIASGENAAPGRYLAIYEIEADSVEVALSRLNESAGTMRITSALDTEGARSWAFSAIGERRVLT